MKLGMVAVLSLSVLMACGKVEDDPNAKDPLHSKTGADAAEDITSRRNCGLAEEPRSSIFGKSWMLLKRTSNNVVVFETLTFQPNGVTKKMICSYGSQSVTATANASASVSHTDRVVMITTDDSQEAELKVGTTTFKCTSKIEKRDEAMKFNFRGPCLNMLATVETELTYVPAN